MAHSIIHTEIYAKDHEKLGAWYGKVFGWQVQSFPDMNYSTGSTSDIPGNGVGFNDAKNGVPPGTITPYIYTPDIEADMRMLAENGAQLNEMIEIPGVGKMCHFKDPDGNLLALLQSVNPRQAYRRGVRLQFTLVKGE